MEISFQTDKPVPRVPLQLYLLALPTVHLHRLSVLAARFESFVMRRRLAEFQVHRPIYVVGLARAGTTITLEMLSHHPDLAAHSYGDMPQPYLTYTWNRLIRALPLSGGKPQERPHRDGIMYTNSSPEAVEEIFWMRFFTGLHDESKSNVLGSGDHNARFDSFYANQIKKLLLARGARRYLAKANYNLTRMRYLLDLFPSARFVIVIREPVRHLVSYLKQQDLLSQLYAADPRWWTIAAELGHFEFGEQMRFINAGDQARVNWVRRLWGCGERVEAFARYWSSIYGHVADALEGDDELRRACLILRHEDLCCAGEREIDRLLAHCELPDEPFASAKSHYAQTLRPPTYYTASLSDEELRTIDAITGPTAGRFGYDSTGREHGMASPHGQLSGVVNKAAGRFASSC